LIARGQGSLLSRTQGKVIWPRHGQQSALRELAKVARAPVQAPHLTRQPVAARRVHQVHGGITRSGLARQPDFKVEPARLQLRNIAASRSVKSQIVALFPFRKRSNRRLGNATLGLNESAKSPKGNYNILYGVGMMSIFKSAMAGATLLSLSVASSAAYAEPVRASGSLPGVVSVNKLHGARTAAPSRKESKYVQGQTYPWGIFIGTTVVVGVGSFFVFRNGNTDVRRPVSG